MTNKHSFGVKKEMLPLDSEKPITNKKILAKHIEQEPRRNYSH